VSEIDREKWDRKYAERGRATREPSAFLVSLDSLLPRSGRALDVAGGCGRHAIWLARRGLDVTLADVSAVGLDLARADANEAGVTLSYCQVDLEREPLLAGPWHVIVDFHFLLRGLFPSLAQELAVGGVLVFCHQTRTNLQRHAKPPEAFLLEDGELPGLVTGLEVVRYDERWHEEGRHEARLIAVRPRE
jgi:SAM-dependent methyltransferase